MVVLYDERVLMTLDRRNIITCASSIVYRLDVPSIGCGLDPNRLSAMDWIQMIVDFRVGVSMGGAIANVHVTKYGSL